MKPFFTKTLDVLTLGTLRRRRVNTVPNLAAGDGSYNSHASITHSMPSNVTHVSEEIRDDTGSWSIYHAASPTAERIDSHEDDVLFCKNNVFLKYPSQRTQSPSDTSNNMSSSSDGSLGESIGHSIPMKPLSTPAVSTTTKPTDQDDDLILIPGYMHISTRGSDFGKTLILNWTPNCHMTPINGGASLENTGPSSVSRSSCSSISIDLGQMESIRIFYKCEPPEAGIITSGEVVISNKERKFKIFYFQHNGLYDLIKKFRSWKYFNNKHLKEAQQHIFTVLRPRLSLAELHDEEGLVSGMLTQSIWKQLQDPLGRVLDKKFVLQAIFFRGVEPPLRNEVWPHLLGLVNFDYTSEEKREKYKERQRTYQQIDKKRKMLMSSGECTLDQSTFQQITNDIRRTDRSHTFYKGDDNDNIVRLENIIHNYLLIYRTDISYCQGMTDLLAPVLMTLNNDAEAFFCFTHLVERSPIFKQSGKKVTLHRQVKLLTALIYLLIPWFYTYLEEVDEGLSLLFTHRWLLVFLKREFKIDDTLLIWESCWTNYATNSFHLFICVAIMAIYGQQAIDQEMDISELTVHFNGLSSSMSVDIVLSQARGYLYQFTKCHEVPCVLRSIMPDDYWEMARAPRISCPGSGICCKGGPLFTEPA